MIDEKYEDNDTCCMECKKCGFHKPSCSQFDEEDD